MIEEDKFRTKQGSARPHGRARIETCWRFILWLVVSCSARPHGRARIETFMLFNASDSVSGSARPHGRARIETASRAALLDFWRVAPGPTVGRGLKHKIDEDNSQDTFEVAPGPTVGRGLKLDFTF